MEEAHIHICVCVCVNVRRYTPAHALVMQSSENIFDLHWWCKQSVVVGKTSAGNFPNFYSCNTFLVQLIVKLVTSAPAHYFLFCFSSFYFMHFLLFWYILVPYLLQNMLGSAVWDFQVPNLVLIRIFPENFISLNYSSNIFSKQL